MNNKNVKEKKIKVPYTKIKWTTYFILYILYLNNYIYILFIIERRLKEAKKPKETPVVQPGIYWIIEKLYYCDIL